MLLGSSTNTPDPSFWSGKRVFITGMTGFKGTWMAAVLKQMGASVSGLGLAPETSPSLYQLCREELDDLTLTDVREKSSFEQRLLKAQPDIVVHMAAQPIVLKSFEEPIDTFETNINGTLNLLQALREHERLMAILVVTSDKVYENSDQEIAFVENASLGGDDPYSASKASTEIIAHCYAKSYFEPLGIPLLTARAGNVIGGGDWSENRLIPDIWRSINSGSPLEVRAPNSTRPWQHVLDANNGYLLFIEAVLKAGKGFDTKSLNFGPLDGKMVTVGEIVAWFESCSDLPEDWSVQQTEAPIQQSIEKTHLQVSAEKANSLLGWRPKLDIPEAVRWTADWYGRYGQGRSAWELMNEQVHAHIEM